jgi:hypothetical protein
MAFVHAAGSGDNNLDVPVDIDRLKCRSFRFDRLSAAPSK